MTLAGFRHLDLASRVDSSGEIAIDLVPYQTTVSLTGMLLNVADPSHYLDVLLTVDGAVTVTGTSFAGAVPARAPFRICAIERAFSGTSAYLYSNTPIAFACVDRPGASGATTVDIDMSMGLALSTLSGRFVAPPSGHPLQGAVPRVFVRDDATAGRYLLGYTSSMAPDADGVSYDFSVVHLSMPGVTTPLAEYYLESATSYSSIFVDGMPGDHPLTDATEWLAAPALMSPLPGSAAGLHDPIVVAPFDPSVPIYLQLRNQYGEVWSLEPAPGVTSLSFPLPPTGTDMRYWMNMRVELYACDPWPGHRSACRRDSGGDTYTVM